MAGLSWLWCMDTGHPKFTHEFISFDITLGKYPVDSSPMFLPKSLSRNCSDSDLNYLPEDCFIRYI